MISTRTMVAGLLIGGGIAAIGLVLHLPWGLTSLVGFIVGFVIGFTYARGDGVPKRRR